MIEKWKGCLDSNGVCGNLLTDLSKVFDCLPHSLLIAKLYANGFDKSSTKYLKDYLSHRKLKTKLRHVATGQIYYVLYNKAAYWVPYFLMSLFVFSFGLHQTPSYFNKLTDDTYLMKLGVPWKAFLCGFFFFFSIITMITFYKLIIRH